MIMDMLMVNVVDAKAKLSEYLDAVSRGERVVICNRNRPVAELRPVAAAPAARQLGTASGEVTMADSFNEPLSDDLLDAFEGREPLGGGAARAAEPRARYTVKRTRKP
jgi:prevent-host-death family protein